MSDRGALKSWLRHRLTGERAKAELIQLCEASWAHLDHTPLSEVLKEEDLLRVVQAFRRPDVFAAMVRPLVGSALFEAKTILEKDEAPIGRYLPDQAKAALTRAIVRPGLVDPEWIRTWFESEGIEALVADTLYAALRDFSTIVPRLILATLPGGRFSVLGGAGALGTKMAEGLERVLEPEIKSFLAGGTQRALARAAEFMVEHRDDPEFLQTRKGLLTFFLERPLAFHLRPVSPERLKDLSELTELAAKHLAADEALGQRLESLVRRLYGDHRHRPVGEILAWLGIDQRPPIAELAAIGFSALVVELERDEARRFLDGLVDELLDQWESSANSGTTPV